MQNNYVVIMAGGIGSRFWPFSKQAKPKQFLDILGSGKTLIQMTYDRFLPICPPDNILVVTNEAYAELVQEQLPGLSSDQILVEPLRKNTAPALAYAARKIAKRDPNAVMIAAPSDHVILQERNFEHDVQAALAFAAHNKVLATIGIKPTRPDTGYGYIQYLQQELENGHGLHKVKTFTEKPSLDIAEMFLASGDFLWNSGIFVWGVAPFLEALAEHAPELADVFSEGDSVLFTPGEQDFIDKAYEMSPNISIDYAVMEKAANVFVLPSTFTWSDLGTWGSLYDMHEKDATQNAVGGANVMMFGSSNCMVKMPDSKLAVLQGLDGFIVVENEDTLLVCKLEHEQEIKAMVAEIKRTKGEKYL